MPPAKAADYKRDMHASRGLIALLVATVLVGALYMLEFKPGGSNPATGGPTQGISGYAADVNAAHQAVAISAGDNARSGADPSTSPAADQTGGPAASTGPAAQQHKTAAAAAHRRAAAKPTRAARDHVARHVRHARSVKPTRHATPADRLSTVDAAMRSHKAVALLFYNSSASDDQATEQELAEVPTRGHRVVKLAIPLTEIANYTAVTDQVPVNFSPTLVLIAPNGQADEIAGFATAFEISQRVDEALALR